MNVLDAHPVSPRTVTIYEPRLLQALYDLIGVDYTACVDMPESDAEILVRYANRKDTESAIADAEAGRLTTLGTPSEALTELNAPDMEY